MHRMLCAAIVCSSFSYTAALTWSIPRAYLRASHRPAAVLERCRSCCTRHNRPRAFTEGVRAFLYPGHHFDVTAAVIATSEILGASNGGALPVHLPTFLAELDWTMYAFMLPVACGVAFLANTAGIGGAALFGPIFLLVFPLLGSKYVLSSPAAAVGTALAVEAFGFTSGLVGYTRKGLVDVRGVPRWWDDDDGRRRRPLRGRVPLP